MQREVELPSLAESPCCEQRAPRVTLCCGQWVLPAAEAGANFPASSAFYAPCAPGRTPTLRSCPPTLRLYPPRSCPFPQEEYKLVPGRMSDMSMRGPELWMRAGWCSDTPVQKLWGFTAWLNSASVTGMVALSSPGERRAGQGTLSVSPKHCLQDPILVNSLSFAAVGCAERPVLRELPGGAVGTLGAGMWGLTQLLDALLVLNEQLNPGDIDVQPWALGWPLHGGVETSIVLAVGRRAEVVILQYWGGEGGLQGVPRGLNPAGGGSRVEGMVLGDTHLISISAKLLASAKQGREGRGGKRSELGGRGLAGVQGAQQRKSPKLALGRRRRSGARSSCIRFKISCSIVFLSLDLFGIP